ncbi:MAG: hypothetical protein GY754_25190 [bacterium]|nr:hypothetical protein [bacterium]
MRYSQKITLLFSLVFLFAIISCESGSQRVTRHKKPKDSVQKKEVKREYKALNIVIGEVVKEEGEPKYVYFKFGSENKKYEYENNLFKKGLIGHIYNDPKMTILAGKFKIAEIYPTISRGEIFDLVYPINPKAVVLIEIDPNFLMK